MKRLRIRTLLLLVATAALVAALLVERRRAARIEAQLQASLAESEAAQAQTLQVLVGRDQLLLMDAQKRAELENELEETKKFLNSAKAEAANGKRGYEKK
jgi:hypothetical protein